METEVRFFPAVAPFVEEPVTVKYMPMKAGIYRAGSTFNITTASGIIRRFWKFANIAPSGGAWYRQSSAQEYREHYVKARIRMRLTTYTRLPLPN